MTQEAGIILKSFLPYKYKISVFSKREGKINLFVPKKGRRVFSPGAIISFFYTAKGSNLFAKKIDILHVPLDSMKDNLDWIHHLLEIFYYFSPLNAVCGDLFRLLQFSFKIGGRACLFEPYFHIVKRICLVKFLVLVGFYPPRELLFLLGLFDDVVGVSLDSSNVQKVRSLHMSLEIITDQNVKEIDRWILQCLQEHPNIAQFKTVPFFFKAN